MGSTTKAVQQRRDNNGLGRVCAKIGAADVHIVDQRPGMANNEVRAMLFEEDAPLRESFLLHSSSVHHR